MIYLDNAATTKVIDEVWQEVKKYMLEDFGNPSAVYRFGLKQEKSLDSARKIIAREIGADSSSILFTPGGTWSNNIGISGILAKGDQRCVVTERLEHASVLNSVRAYESKRKIIYLDTDEFGRIRPESLENILKTEDVCLVSLMQINNELGGINDLEAVSSILKKHKDIVFQVDGVQGFCKYPIDVKKMGIDIYSMSSHKIHGPKGVGAIYLKNLNKLKALTYGGGQELGLIPGTENVPGIMGFAKAVEVYSQDLEEAKIRLLSYKKLIVGALEEIGDFRINQDIEKSSAFIMNIAFKGIKSEILLHMLDDDGIMVSSGSACTGGKKSHVLTGLGMEKEFIDGAIRLSFSKYTTREEIEIFTDRLKKNIIELRKIIGR